MDLESSEIKIEETSHSQEKEKKSKKDVITVSVGILILSIIFIIFTISIYFYYKYKKNILSETINNNIENSINVSEQERNITVWVTNPIDYSVNQCLLYTFNSSVIGKINGNDPNFSYYYNEYLLGKPSYNVTQLNSLTSYFPSNPNLCVSSDQILAVKASQTCVSDFCTNTDGTLVSKGTTKEIYVPCDTTKNTCSGNPCPEITTCINSMGVICIGTPYINNINYNSTFCGANECITSIPFNFENGQPICNITDSSQLSFIEITDLDSNGNPIIQNSGNNQIQQNSNSQFFVKAYLRNDNSYLMFFELLEQSINISIPYTINPVNNNLTGLNFSISDPKIGNVTFVNSISDNTIKNKYSQNGYLWVIIPKFTVNYLNFINYTNLPRIIYIGDRTDSDVEQLISLLKTSEYTSLLSFLYLNNYYTACNIPLRNNTKIDGGIFLFPFDLYIWTCSNTVKDNIEGSNFFTSFSEFNILSYNLSNLQNTYVTTY